MSDVNGDAAHSSLSRLHGAAEAALREKQIGNTMQRLADAREWLIVDQTEDLGS